MLRRPLLLVGLLCILLTCCAQNQNTVVPEPSPRTSEPVHTPASAPPDPALDMLKAMSLDQKLGQMLIAGFQGTHPGEDARKLIQEHNVGGVILMPRNVQTATQLLAALNALKAMNPPDSPALFLAVDEEGGRVSRLPPEFVSLPPALAMSHHPEPEHAYNTGVMLARLLFAFGYNMNFAPVLDIHSNPLNPVIGDRAIGTDERVVSSLGVQVMLGMQSGAIISVPKHFPGHGDTSSDSHVSLPVLAHGLERLLEVEIPPFEAAIRSGADAIMVAHILFPEIDPERAASLSATFVTGLLRQSLGFDGVVITDDLTMNAITQVHTIADAAVLAVEAGVDIVLVCHGYDNQIEVLDALKLAVNSGRLEESRIDESVYRVLKLKMKYALEDTEIDHIDTDALNADTRAHIESVLKR